MSKNTTLPEIKEGYFKHTVNSKFITSSMFFLMYMPVFMSGYSKLVDKVKNQGLEPDWETGMIEKSAMFGNGWIGMAGDSGDKEVSGDFIAYKIVGKYSQMREAYQKMMKDYPRKEYGLSEVYNIYMTDPDVTPEDENVTYIIFR